MNTIPTAEEFLNSEENNLHSYYFPNGDSTKQRIHDKDCRFCNYEDSVAKMLKNFAKLHLQAQQKAILKNVSLTNFAQEFLQEGASEAIDEASITSAYNINEQVK